ncbi:ras GTPase-activating protein 3 [Plakobranchus ocellatus]|uniref:Ras GTPase-activating protein 3 n=1 Tax=Plakobranchus ocellatus TaxID=259542 RepID=A0AAV4BBS7_9GAST|nr:ras GTPase-activating protein 3 [Plakobranchus ocellatus]
MFIAKKEEPPVHKAKRANDLRVLALFTAKRNDHLVGSCHGHSKNWGINCPFYNAEFQGEIPKKFRHLSVYVYDVSNKNSKVIGKVSLKKEELYKFHQKDHWFPLTQQDGDTEVQGKVQVEVKLGEVLTSSCATDNTTHRLAVRVCECSDLTVINGSCNPYAVVSLSYGKSRNKEVKRTAVKKKTICPQFDEKFFFYFDKSNNQDKTNYAFDDFMSGELSVSLFHDDSKVSREVLGNMFKGAFLGEVKIPVREIDVSKPHIAWYCLQAKENHRSCQQPLGSLRLRISYSADYVFPSEYYNGLRELVLESSEAKHVTSSAAFILGEVVSNREDAAKPLVKLFLHHGRLVPLIHALADWEMSNTIDPNTLFRGNSLLTKMVDELMKLMGIPYLQDTLQAFIDQVVSEAKPCEIDPKRIKDGEDITANLANLFGYVTECIDNIVNSSLVCPSVMRDVFSTLKARAMLNYPDNSAVRHHAVTSFIFLRFFTAAVLSPTMFDLHSDILDAPVQRTLTLISKSISAVVNCISSKSVSSSLAKQSLLQCVRLGTMARGPALLRGIGGTMVSKYALRSTGTFLSWVQASPPVPWPD